jgi:hypothetical protein
MATDLPTAKFNALATLTGVRTDIADMEWRWLYSIVTPRVGTLDDMWAWALYDAGYDDKFDMLVDVLGYQSDINTMWLDYWLNYPGQGVGAALLTVPDTADSFYVVVTKPSGVIDAIHFQRNTGGNTGSDAGSQWPEWRVTGRARLNSVDDDPASANIVFTEDVGAQDIVANDGTKYLGSYHGLGAGGTLTSQTLTLDGNTFDPTTVRSGNSLVIRNVSTAVNGANSFTRDLTTTVTEEGKVHFKINSISTGGTISYVYLGMLIGTGLYNRADILEAGSASWHPGPTLSTSQTVAGRILPSVISTGVRLVDMLDGRAVTLVGAAIPSLANYVQGEVLRDPLSADRLKGYFARFSSVAALADAEWDMDAEIVGTNESWVDGNLFTNGDFASGDLTGWTRASGAGTATIVSGAMQQVREVAANHRMRQTNSFAATTDDIWAYRMDLIDLSGGTAPTVRVSTANTLSFVGAMVDRQLTTECQWVFYFRPTVTTLWAGIEHTAGAVADTVETDNYWLANLNGAEGIPAAPSGYVFLAGKNADTTHTILRGQTSASVYTNLAGKV